VLQVMDNKFRSVIEMAVWYRRLIKIVLYIMIILVASTKQISFTQMCGRNERFRNSVLLKQLSCLFKQGGRVLRGRLFVVLWIKTKQYETCSKVQRMHIY